MNILRKMQELDAFVDKAASVPNKSVMELREYREFSSLNNKLKLWEKSQKTFLLSKDLIDAFSMTTVPLDLTPGEFKYPYDVFMISGEKPLLHASHDVMGEIPIFHILAIRGDAINSGGKFMDPGGAVRSAVEWDLSVSGLSSRPDVYAMDHIWVNLKNDQEMRVWCNKTSSDLRSAVSEDETQRLANIFFNTIMYINEPGRDKVFTEEPGRSRLKMGGKKKATLEYIKLKPPKDYVSIAGGSGRTIDARFTVRGHWTNQAYGKGRSLRRRIWIKPYWKGPELSEIVSKKYKVD